MGTSPMGFYLRRGSDGRWLGAVAGGTDAANNQPHDTVPDPPGRATDSPRERWWVRALGILREGLGRADRLS